MRLPTSLKCLLRLGMIGSCCWNVAWRLHPPGNMRLTLRKRLELGAPLHRSGAICRPVLEFRDESLTDATKSIIAKPEASASRGALTASRLPRHTCVCVCVRGNCVFTYTCMYIYIYIYIYLSLSLLHEGVCTCLFASSATQRQSHCGTPFQAEALQQAVQWAWNRHEES